MNNSIAKLDTLETTFEALKAEYGEENVRKGGSGYSVRIVGTRSGLELHVPEMVALAQYGRRLDLRKGFEIPSLESMVKKTRGMWGIGFLFCYRAIRSSEIVGKRRIEILDVTLCAPEDSTYVIIIPRFYDDGRGRRMTVYSPAIFCYKMDSAESGIGRCSYSIVKVGSFRFIKTQVRPEIAGLKDYDEGRRASVIKIANDYLGVQTKCEDEDG